MNNEQKQLWKLGIERLREIHQAKLAFNLKSWAGNDHPSVYEGENAVCGTTACAMGYFALMPEFQEKGLQLRKGTKEVLVKTFEEFLRTKPSTEFEVRMLGVRGGDGIEAAMKLFGIYYGEAEKCFISFSYGHGTCPTAADVADRMEEILQNY